MRVAPFGRLNHAEWPLFNVCLAAGIRHRAPRADNPKMTLRGHWVHPIQRR